MSIPKHIKPFWQKFEAAVGRSMSTRFYEAFSFDDHEASANALAELVLRGKKRATASLLWTNEVENTPAPKVGDVSVVTNWEQEPLCVIETTQVEIVPYEEVTADFAAAEGEGDLSLRYWREAHWAFFGRECQRLGKEPSMRMPVICERFRVLYPEIDRHEANRRHWDATAERWRKLREQDGIWRNCVQEPHLAFEGRSFEIINEYLGTLAGKEACVIGSGDNYAAFALAGAGAQVTSVDISQRQLDIAAERADTLGLNINFVRSDAARLAKLQESSFDLVVSTNGFFVWIADLGAVFAAVQRILKPGGFYVFYDIHPFMRPWKQDAGLVRMQKPYWDRRPSGEKDAEGTSEFHWTLSDLINPLAQAGFRLRRVVESPPRNARFYVDASYEDPANNDLMDWQQNEMAGLPAWITVAAQKG